MGNTYDLWLEGNCHAVKGVHFCYPWLCSLLPCPLNSVKLSHLVPKAQCPSVFHETRTFTFYLLTPSISKMFKTFIWTQFFIFPFPLRLLLLFQDNSVLLRSEPKLSYYWFTQGNALRRREYVHQPGTSQQEGEPEGKILRWKQEYLGLKLAFLLASFVTLDKLLNQSLPQYPCL